MPASWSPHRGQNWLVGAIRVAHLGHGHCGGSSNDSGCVGPKTQLPRVFLRQMKAGSPQASKAGPDTWRLLANDTPFRGEPTAALA